MTDWKNRIVGQGEEDPRKIVGNPRNWRIHPLAQGRGLEGVLGEIGWIAPVTINRTTGYCLDGHLRVALAVKRGAKSVPVQYVELNEAEEALALATLDPLSAMAETDADKLGELLEQIQTDDAAVEALLAGVAERAGIEADEDIPEDPGPQVDRAEELQEKWRVQRGQVWQIGKHRLMCGDSTSEQDVGRLMGEARAGLMNTDPPYGVGYANDERPHPGVAKPRVAKDEFHDEELQRFLESAFGAAVHKALLPNAAWYLWHAHLTQGFFAAAAAAAAAVILHRQIIWVKPVLLLGRGQYHWKHEPCFMGWVRGHEPPDYGLGNGERVQTTVWEISPISAAERREFNHSTPKPVGLFTIPIIKHLRQNEACYDPFTGTGPQFVAAEQTGRICYGMEIEPKYCAVTLERLALMGLEPRLCNA